MTTAKVQRALIEVWPLWNSAPVPVAPPRHARGWSRHTRRRQNWRRYPRWEKEVRQIYNRSFDQEHARNRAAGSTTDVAAVAARDSASRFLADLVHASWSFSDNPDFFGDLYAAACSLGVKIPLHIHQRSAIGPGKKPRSRVTTTAKRIRLRM